MKRTFSLVLAILIVLGLTACGKTSTSGDTDTTVTSTKAAVDSQTSTAAPEQTKLFDKPVTISMITYSNASWPFKEDWFILKAIKDATNVTMDVKAYGDEANDKIQLAIASGDLPDIIYMDTVSANTYAMDGPFVCLSDNMKNLPSFTKWYETTKSAKEDLKSYTAADGKVYMFPIVGGLGNNEMGWLIRKDILDKNKLAIPTTDEELYNVLKALKTAYPESYPFALRKALEVRFDVIGPEWSTSNDAYFDFDKNEWKYGPIEDNFKEMVLFFKKLVSEGLISPDFLTMPTNSWVELLSSSKSFVTCDYITRLDFFNKPMKTENPDANMVWMAPIKGGTNGKNKLLRTSYNGGGNVVCNTKNSDNAMKFVDWLYSDQGMELTNWGKEGETYKVVNNERQFITDEKGSTKEMMYGLLTFGFNLRMDDKCAETQYKGGTLDGIKNYYNYCEEHFNPEMWMAFTKDETDTMNPLKVSITTNMQENITKFILGQVDMSGWDAYVAKMKSLGTDKYLSYYKTAYDRIK
ncbi:MAG: extracellular solute-binding protein [Clostridiaceae bacterium]